MTSRSAHQRVRSASRWVSTAPCTTYRPGETSVTWLAAGSAAASDTRSSPGGASNRRLPPDPAAVSCSGLPCATTWPWSTTTTWSASRSASSMKCVVSTTVTPSCRRAATSSQVARRACGSRPAVGSSRNTSSGRPTTAIASESRCCWPPDSRRYAVRPADPSPRRSTRAADVERVRVQRGHVPQHLLGLDAGVDPALLEHHADPWPQGARVAARVEAEHPDAARVGPAVALAGLDGRGLARAVRPEDRGDRAGLDGEREPATAALSPYRLTRSTTSTAGVMPGVYERRSGPARAVGRPTRSAQAAPAARRRRPGRCLR